MKARKGDYLVDVNNKWFGFDGEKWEAIEEPKYRMGLAFHVVEYSFQCGS